MKRTKTASKTDAPPEQEKCKHEDTHPAAAFLDSDLEEAWMLQVCDTCGKSFFLMGIYRPEIYG